jgi:hypothetical protein
MFIVNKKAMPNQEYPFYVTIKDRTNFHTWKQPAFALKIKTLYEYVKFLRDNYDVKISVNFFKNNPYNLSIDFKHESEAKALADLSNKGAGLCQT